MKGWIFRGLGRVLGTCRETTTSASDDLEGALPPDVAARVHRHLKVCPGCRAHRATMEASVRTCGTLPREEVTADEKAELLARFRKRP